MFPGEELHVLAGQRELAVIGDGHAFVVTERETGVEHLFARTQDQCILRVILAVDAEGIEQAFHVDRQGELVILFEDRLHQCLTLAGAAGIQLQQAVAAGMQLGFQCFAGGAARIEQRGPVAVMATFEQCQQARAELLLQGVAGRTGIEEGVQGGVVPLEQALLGAAFQIGHMQFDGVALADAVEAADALFEQVRVGWQVEQHQMMGELEVAAFGADFRADQHLGAEFLVGEVGRGTVALEDAHAFVEHRGRGAGAHAQGLFQVEGGFGVGADHQHLGLAEHLQGIDQPLDARIEFPPAWAVLAILAPGLVAGFRVQVGVFTERQFQVLHRVGQRIGVQLTGREALHGGAGVAQQHAAGAVTVEQFADQPGTGRLVTALDAGQQGIARAAKEPVDGAACCRGEAAVVEQFLNRVSDRPILGAFGAERFEVVEAIRVEQAQAGEVAFQTELLGGGGEQQHAGDVRGELFDQTVLGAGAFRMPDQMVRLVDHQQIPFGLQHGLPRCFIALQPVKGDQRQLAVLEGILCIAGEEAFGVEQADLQIEAPAHFHQPLVLEVFRNEDQGAAGTAGEQLAVQDQAGFDGLAQTHLVGQQHSRAGAVGHLAGDVQLVGDRLGAGTTQAPQRGLQQARAVFEAVVAQGEPAARVDLPGEQAVAGQAELDEVGQLGFRQAAGLLLGVDAVVDQQAVDVLDFLHGQLPAFEVGDLVTGGEAHPGQRRIAQCVLAGIAGRRVENGKQAAVLGEDGAEPQLRFTVADPALSRLILRHACLPPTKSGVW